MWERIWIQNHGRIPAETTTDCADRAHGVTENKFGIYTETETKS